MSKLGSNIREVVAAMGGDSKAARLNFRIGQVRERYRKAIESVYPHTAQLHLAHTNSVIITSKGGVRTLVVYVDDSIFAAELNAQRELVKLRLLELSGEDIDDFQIKVSKWKKYREQHPYLDQDDLTAPEPVPSIPLDVEELEYVQQTIARIEDETIRESLEKAMTADLQWKKGEKLRSSQKNENRVL